VDDYHRFHDGAATMRAKVCSIVPIVNAAGPDMDPAETVTAELAFNDGHELVDFTSDDRLRASPDGRSVTRQRWSTPVRDYRAFGPRRIGLTGEGRWHAPNPRPVSPTSSSTLTRSPTTRARPVALTAPAAAPPATSR
jgi:hypothetical protein